MQVKTEAGAAEWQSCGTLVGLGQSPLEEAMAAVKPGGLPSLHE